MFVRHIVPFALLASLGVAQVPFAVRPSATPAPPDEKTLPNSDKDKPQNIALVVPKGAPLEIGLKEDVRVKKAGQEIHGSVLLPVYAFDHMVVPAGAEVIGHIVKVEDIPRTKRVMGALNADFTPPHDVQVEFSEIDLANGQHIPFNAVITPGSGQPIQIVSARETKKKGVVQDEAAKKIDEAKRQARDTWNQAMKQVNEPGRMHRLKQYAEAQLPVRAQYLRAGTVYFAELQQPLDFGSEANPPSRLAYLGTPPPSGSLVHAFLVTPLDSASTQKGADVEAVLSQPLFDGDRLILCEGARLKGSVVQVRPARLWHHNGQLRIVFRELVPPDGIQQRVVAGLESIQAGRGDNVKLDSEGGAEATSPKTRYASTALTLALTTAAFRSHTDADDAGKGGSNNGVAGGLAGFKLVGIVLGLAAHSQPAGMAMGAYGSARSVYANFIARGRDVVFAKNTPMEISLGPPHKPALTSSESAGQPPEPH